MARLRANGADVGAARPTLEMVAATAGVSRSTASRVLAGASNVSPRAVQAVSDAARRLRYTPNLSARGLATGRTGLVGLVVNQSGDDLFGDPFFAMVLRGAHAVLTAADVALVLSLVGSAAERDLVLDRTAARLDGLLVVYAHGDPLLRQRVGATGLPAVYAGRTPARGRSGSAWVDADSVGGAARAVEHLLERGRRRIATITGPLDMAAGADRLAGWRAALRSAAVPAPASLVEPGTFRSHAGAAAMARLLDRRPDLDAVFVANDVMALAAIAVLRGQGRRVPEDVAVVGFDDIPAAALADPPLTTVAQDAQRMGELMARQLLRMLAGDRSPYQEMLPTHLVVRGTT